MPLEIERTFLAKYLPDLSNCEKKEILYIYLPKSFPGGHAPIRLRKNGEKYELTKKSRASEFDGSKLIEENIKLTKAEFEALEKEIEGLRVQKVRYLYPLSDGLIAEIDVFLGKHKGLVLVEIETNDEEKLKKAKMPDFCLIDVTQNRDLIAGGVLCKTSFSELEDKLSKLGYKKI